MTYGVRRYEGGRPVGEMAFDYDPEWDGPRRGGSRKVDASPVAASEPSSVPASAVRPIDVRVDAGMPGVRGLTPEQLADLADGFGVDGPADGLMSFAAEMQAALIRACGIPAHMLEVCQ